MSNKEHRIVCKLRDDIDLDDVTDTASICREVFKSPGMADKHPGMRVRRLFHGVSRAELDEFTAASMASPQIASRAARAPKGRLSNLDSNVLIKVPESVDVKSLVRELQDVNAVEAAFQDCDCEVRAAGDAEPLTLPQEYLDPARGGIDVRAALAAGGDGSGINFADVENDWTLNHGELAHKQVEQLTVAGPERTGAGPFASHGTQVLQIVFADSNGMGITGIAPAVDKAFVASALDMDRTAAIVKATNRLRREGGGVLLIELQQEGAGSLPLEASSVDFDVIQMAAHQPAATPVVVIECAGNGKTNLDSVIIEPTARSLRRGENGDDSGAILVAAVKHGISRRRFSQTNFGSRVDCHAWGERVTTTVDQFGGTSAAGAIIAGVCCAVQSIHKKRHGGLLSSLEMRALLARFPARRRRRRPLQDEDNLIGGLPDVRRIVESL